ncbi:MAG TPA: Uma2 family endonuclease [Gemmataceae bacterium]|nr:Uma2 family endonuclease [Gemmataceae bacterium]
MAESIKAPPRRKQFALPPFPDGGTPTWEIAYLFPAQGTWTEDDYFNLDGIWEGIPRVELSNGYLEVLPVPTEIHQIIIFVLLQRLAAFTRKHAPGLVLPSGMRIKLWNRQFRDADIAYMKAENASRRRKRYWLGADLVMEVVSGDAKDIKRDWETKLREYAKAGIAEYWIVDPEKEVIRVLTLEGKAYKVHGDFGPGTKATSVLLPGFTVPVDEVLCPEGASQED